CARIARELGDWYFDVW
nr:immunoglobulin heavy chain junction region [Mus musculus]